MLLTEGARVKIANKDRYKESGDWSEVEAIHLLLYRLVAEHLRYDHNAQKELSE